MLRKSMLLSALLLSQGLFSVENPPLAQDPLPVTEAKKAESGATIPINGRNWKLGHEAKEQGKLIREYVLENEDVNNWTELFSIQEFSSVPVSPNEFFQLFVDGLKQAVPDNTIKSRVIQDKPTVLFGEWWIEDNTPNDQHEWIKIFKDGEEIFIARYTTKKTKEVEAQRKSWEAFFDGFSAQREMGL